MLLGATLLAIPIGHVVIESFDDQDARGMNFELLRLEKWGEEFGVGSDHHYCG